MMMLDLVSPWAAALQANDEASRTSFRQLHAPLLDLLHHSQTPDHHFLPLASELKEVAALQQLVEAGTLDRVLLDTASRAIDFGANPPVTIVLLPVDGVEEMTPLITRRDSYAILALNSRTSDPLQLQIQLARALAALTRWHAADSESVLRSGDGHWDRWELARTVPLREWIYTAGVSWQLAQALFPDMPLHQLFGLGANAWQRLRELEQVARERLIGDLDESGIGLIMKWLQPGGSVARRGDADQFNPKLGQYLAWRMTAKRVTRVGIRVALRAAS